MVVIFLNQSLSLLASGRDVNNREAGEFEDPNPLYHHDSKVFPHLEEAKEDVGDILDNPDGKVDDRDLMFAGTIWPFWKRQAWSFMSLTSTASMRFNDRGPGLT